MFICSVKPKDFIKRLLLIALLILITVCAIRFLKKDAAKDPASPLPSISQTHDTHAPDNASRIAFLNSFGWKVSKEPIEVVQVVIPETFGDVYQNYNAIQTEQGFDLSKFKGKQVTRSTYSVLNYPEQKEYIRANLLIYNDEIIGGDICSVYAKNGFMHGFAFPTK